MTTLPSKPRKQGIIPGEAMEENYKALLAREYGASMYRTAASDGYSDGYLYSLTLDGRILDEAGIDPRLAGQRIERIKGLTAEDAKILAEYENPEEFARFLKERGTDFKRGMSLGILTQDRITHVTPQINFRYEIVPVETIVPAEGGQSRLDLHQVNEKGAKSLYDAGVLDFLCRVKNTGAWSLNLATENPSQAKERYNKLKGLTKGVCDGVEICPVNIRLGNA